jgi:predicted RNase H-like HicB family nuclease
MTTLQYLVVVERAADNYSAWCPDLPGCVATGASVEETIARMHEAIELHLTGLREDRLPIPKPVSIGELVTVSA